MPRLGEPSRITVEGRADADPIAPNSTPEGRERNRRIEVVLYSAGWLIMKALRFLASRWVLSFVGVAILALLVWFFGPLLPLLEGWVARLVVILCLLAVWAAANVALDFNRRRREQKLEVGVAEKAADEADDRSNEEAAALRDRMSTALSLLKRARGTRGYLYEQPWYVIIGPPGAGKTTALLNSGLKFPLAAEMGQGRSPASAAPGSVTGGSRRMPC